MTKDGSYESIVDILPPHPPQYTIFLGVIRMVFASSVKNGLRSLKWSKQCVLRRSFPDIDVRSGGFSPNDKDSLADQDYYRAVKQLVQRIPTTSIGMNVERCAPHNRTNSHDGPNLRLSSQSPSILDTNLHIPNPRHQPPPILDYHVPGGKIAVGKNDSMFCLQSS